MLEFVDKEPFLKINSRPTVVSLTESVQTEVESGFPKLTPSLLEAGHDTRVEQAETRTEQAEARTEQAKSRTEQAESRTEQAEARTEQAEARIEQAKSRTEQAESRAEKAEHRTEAVQEHSDQARAQSDHALRASEISYRRLFEAAKDGILILDVVSGRINDANPFLTELLGFSKGEMLGKTVGELSPFKDIESNKIMLERLKRDGYVRYEDLPLETRDGHHIAVEFVSNVYQAGEGEVIQCNIRDITQRKQEETDIRNQKAELEQRVAERTAQLETANHELQAFSYSVAHDLRAPLRHILGFVNQLEQEAGPTLSPECVRHLQKISEASTRMGKLIDALLQFSHLGRTELKKADVELAPLVAEILPEFEPETAARLIRWEVGALPTVRADRALLRTVLVNLISNAVKFTTERTDPRIEIGCAPHSEGMVTIFVRDNGAGFDPNYSSKLFGVFQRLHSQEDFPGTGIGLANVQRIIKRHGGRVWAEGVVGTGATFYFSIPQINGTCNGNGKSPS